VSFLCLSTNFPNRSNKTYSHPPLPDAEVEEEVVTVESLTEKMEEIWQTMKVVWAHLTEVQKEKKDII
jgi:hypothetical protein